MGFEPSIVLTVLTCRNNQKKKIVEYLVSSKKTKNILGKKFKFFPML